MGALELAALIWVTAVTVWGLLELNHRYLQARCQEAVSDEEWNQ